MTVTITDMEGKIKKARNFRNYKVWQDAVDYATRVYKVTADMPWFEKKGLCDQLQGYGCFARTSFGLNGGEIE